MELTAATTTRVAAQLAYLLGVDHQDHEALLAIDEDDGDAVAVGRFVRLEDSPFAAEAAVLVIDDWQGFGLGKAVCWLLAERARQLGIERFEATMLGNNRAMKTVLESLGEIRVVSDDGTTVTYTVSPPERGVGEPLSGVLRAVDDGGTSWRRLARRTSTSPVRARSSGEPPGHHMRKQRFSREAALPLRPKRKSPRMEPRLRPAGA